MRMLIVLLAVGLLGGCALTDLNPFDEPKLEVNAAVGKNVKQEKAQIKVETGKQEAERISNDTSQTAETIRNVTQNVPTTLLIVMVGLISLFAGWAIPTPGDTGRWFRSVVIDVYGGVKVVVRDVLSLVVTPVRGFGDWVLRLLGRS